MLQIGWSDAFRRALATLILLLTITAGAAIVPAHPFTTSIAVADDDDGDDGDDEDDDGNNGQGGDDGDDNSGKGRGNDKDKKERKEKDDPADHDQGQGNDDRPDGPVTPLPEFRIVIECAPVDDGRSACFFLGLGSTGVKRLAVPQAEVCTTVDGNSGDDDSPEAEMLNATTGDAAYLSDDDAFLLILDGVVETTETTTYWVWADDDQLYPATGPALVCNEAEPAPEKDATAPTRTTGTVVIRAFLCGPDVAAGADVDWYAACTEPAASASFSIQPAIAGTAGTAQTGETDAGGQLTVPDLAPGTYRVDQTDGNWCHAESDNVDDQGNVIVEPGIDATIWVFDCQDAAGS